MEPEPHLDIPIMLTDGNITNVRTWESDGPVCLLLHGFGEGAFVWNDFAKRISPHFKVIAVDFRGHGRSSWTVGGAYSLDLYLQDTKDLIAALGLKSFSLIGHSLGGTVAVGIALEKSFNISCLVLVDISPEENSEPTEHLRKLFQNEQRLYSHEGEYREVICESRALMSKSALDHYVRDAIHRDGSGDLLLRRDPVLINLLNGSQNEIDWHQKMSELNIPTLIVRGVGSAVLTKSCAAELVTRLQDGRLSTVARAGHAVMTDNPDGFVAAVTPFLAKHGLV